MYDFEGRMRQWEAQRTLQDEARARTEFLNRPPARNPPELLKATRCKVLRSFYLKGCPVDVGATVELERHDALSLQALGKVEIL
jgi:hypothetical protein